MPQVLKQPVTKVVTKDGECTVTIALELTINLNTMGIVSVDAKTQEQVQAQAKPVEEETKENLEWMMPDLRNLARIKFGKIVGE